MRVATSSNGVTHLFRLPDVIDETDGATSLCGSYHHTNAFSGVPEDFDVLDNLCGNCEAALDDEE